MARSQNTNRRVVDNMPYAIQFDGTQRVTLGTMGTMGSSLMGAFSYGIWIKTTSQLTTPAYYFGTSKSPGSTYLLNGITRNGSNVGMINFQLRDDSGHSLGAQVSGQRVNDGRWHFIVGTKDATNQVSGMKIYIDGVSKTLSTISNTALTDCTDFNRNFSIGSGLGSGAVTNGWIGALSRPYFFTRELTPTEVSDWYYKHVVPTTPFAGYENTTGSGTTITDVNGTYNGTLSSAAQWITSTPYKSRTARSI